jgi:hypothetical protein
LPLKILVLYTIHPTIIPVERHNAIHPTIIHNLFFQHKTL